MAFLALGRDIARVRMLGKTPHEIRQKRTGMDKSEKRNVQIVLKAFDTLFNRRDCPLERRSVKELCAS